MEGAFRARAFRGVHTHARDTPTNQSRAVWGTLSLSVCGSSLCVGFGQKAAPSRHWFCALPTSPHRAGAGAAGPLIGGAARRDAASEGW